LPIGAVVVVNEDVVGRAHTQEREQNRLLVHAELLALEQADRTLGRRRAQARLFTTLEPCLGCLGAAMTTMVGAIVFALESPSDGGVSTVRAWESSRDHSLFPAYRLPPVTAGVLRADSVAMFRSYVEQHPSDGPMTAWARSLATT
jgi:tRNA(adenine34) deaminase